MLTPAPDRRRDVHHRRGAIRIFGRPAGMWAIERVMEIARKSKDVWIGTRAEVAAHVRKVLKS